MTGPLLSSAQQPPADPQIPRSAAGIGVARGRGLLASWRAHGRSDLWAHLSVHGPLPVLDAASSRRLVQAVADAGLTGRGGAGFPAARKLDAHRRSGGGTIVVNAMEREPASAKDAALAHCAPHLVLDGAECAAAVTGARRVVVCVADDRDDVAAAFEVALTERRRDELARTGGVRVRAGVARPPSRYVMGEESALVGWLDRGRAVPQFRVDRAVPLRLGARPALVHNAETAAHLALLARTLDKSPTSLPPLTTLVTVSGAVALPGVFEIEVGTRLADVIACARPAAPIGAVLVGGFGGSWLGADEIERPFSTAGLAPAGASPGAGVLVVIASASCGLVQSSFIVSAMASESAGQCGPCVFGLTAVAGDLADLAAGCPDPGLVRRVRSRLDVIEGRGACRHPDGVARMVRSALEVFAPDVAAHAARRPCEDARSQVLGYRGVRARRVATRAGSARS